jgi:pimeloyl-ACP methyl ester carboxylesterase
MAARERIMGSRSAILAVFALLACAVAVKADDAPVKGALDTPLYRATFIKLGLQKYEGMLFEPRVLGPRSHIALVFSFPRNQGTGDDEKLKELVNRGYRGFVVRTYDEHDSPYDGLRDISAAITYMRSRPGVDKVLVIGHSGGARQVTNYTNYAWNGPSGCQRPGLLLPCETKKVTGLAKPDGLIALDLPPGPIFSVWSLDPAYVKGNPNHENPDLDMFSAANGYDPKTMGATYTPDFRKRFFAAQSARNNLILDDAVATLKRISKGKNDTTSDAALTVPGVVSDTDNGWVLALPDISLMSHSKRPHTVIRTDGTIAEEIIHTTRPPLGPTGSAATTGSSGRAFIDQLSCCAISGSIRSYLGSFGTRTTKEFAITDDDIVGVDWHSNVDSPVAALEGIRVPVMIEVNTCYRFIVSSEIAYDHTASKDKTLVALDGALHGFTPCKAEYGDTQTRVFNYIDSWLSKPGRFL